LAKKQQENKTQLALLGQKLSNKKIIAKVRPAVVYIETSSDLGSGFIVSRDGYVLTNAHVVSGTNGANVTLSNGNTYFGTVVGRDENIDLALLKIAETNLPAETLGDSDQLEQGDYIYTFGYPLGIEGDVSFKEGTVSRRLTSNGISWIEISAQILPGNSGGPLVDGNGDVVGINTFAKGQAKVADVLVGETLKYAMPINVAKSLFASLKAGRNVIAQKPQTPAPTSSCPANSHQDPSNSNTCICDRGFQVNSSKTACVLIPTPTPAPIPPAMQQPIAPPAQNQTPPLTQSSFQFNVQVINKTANSAVIKWDYQLYYLVRNFVIKYGTDSSSLNLTKNSGNIVNPAYLEVKLENLTPKTTYYYQIKTEPLHSYPFDTSEIYSFTTLPTELVPVTPTVSLPKPTNVKAADGTITDKTATIIFDTNLKDCNYKLSVRIEYGTTTNLGSTSGAGWGAYCPGQGNQGLNGLTPSTTYYFRVVFIDPDTNSSTTSDINSFTTLNQ